MAFTMVLLMRDRRGKVRRFLDEIKKDGDHGIYKREFMMQLQNFIKDCKYYPPEARYPWDKLGHIVREYCTGYGQDKLYRWQQITLDLIRRQR